WNLKAIAAKAQEAAARIEAQLDNSVGLEGIGGGAGGGTSTSSLTAGGGGQQESDNIHDDSYLNEDDDFFSDSHDDGGGVSAGSALIEPTDTVVSPTLDIDDKVGVLEEETDFVEDKVEEDEAEQFMEREDEEEVDFGGDGWDDEGGDDIYDDDDEELEGVDVQKEEPNELFHTDMEASTNYDQDVASQHDDEAIDRSSNDNFEEEHHEVVDQPEHPEHLDHDSLPVNEEEDITHEAHIDEGDDQIKDQSNETTTVEAEAKIKPQNEMIQVVSMDDAEKQQFLETIASLESQLMQREEQLASKSDQITSLTLQSEAETAKLRQVITETKDEAKKRILRAKERVEEMQTKLSDAVRRADAAGGSNQEQSDIINALRAEGEQLARKQRDMEQSVRNAKGQARDLHEKLDSEKGAKEQALTKVESLEKEVKSLKDDLTSARKGESHSKKLESDLVATKEESEKQRASNLGLEQQVKELKEENKSLKKEVEDAKSGAAMELEGESNKLRKERDEMLSDLESKLRTSEREANVREDALRHEVSELRKRWQDAVRRAEDLSMDVQQSTAPLLRQLESAERQSRSRSSAWSEMEAKLRSEIEDHVIQLEKLTKERNDLRANDKRSQRLLKEKEAELVSSQETIDELAATIESLESKLEELEDEGKRMKEEWVKVERQASEGVAKARNDMMKTVVDSEERYREQIETLEDDLESERQKRSNLEKQLDDLAKSVEETTFSQGGRVSEVMSPQRNKKLRASQDQAAILHDALAGFDSEEEDEQDDDDAEVMNQAQSGVGSFAAMEQLSQGLKGAKVELQTLRKQLESSEETRESLVTELGEARQAVEKLPLFEEKVSELTMEIKLKDMEIKGLQDDIADVRFLYRQQLDSLLEEKAASSHPSTLLEEPSELSLPLQDEEEDV
ncbi:putative TATA element modulatory factor, partial [Skeletonema marinoi]